MDKNTKLLLGVGLVAVGAYLLIKKPKKIVYTASFSGENWNDVVGDRRGFAGNLPAKDSRWVVTGNNKVETDSSADLNGILSKGETTDATQGTFFHVSEPQWN